MDTFRDQLAVVTGGGTGMGRELVRQLAAAGADVAMCDVNEENMAGTTELVASDGSTSVKLSSHICDVSDEAQVLAFRDAVMVSHDTEHIDVLFNNAGIGGGGSFVEDERDSWELTYNVCWNGVYYCARAFMDMLVKSQGGALVNTSSINGFWASIGPDTPHTAYSAAKFAVKGFTEALITDFRVTAPHLSAHVVMPGHIGTSIAINSTEAHGGVDIVTLRKRLALRGLPVDQLSDEELEAIVVDRGEAFRDDAPTSAAQAATIILDGVLAGQWRILVGDDAEAIDEMVRSDPWSAYESDFIDRMTEAGHFGGLIR
ncbi:MAG: SDR family NAD(P)-dependent oxidoreductase [Acidimicrobiales bacterium]